MHIWRFPAQLVRIVDGDTMVMRLDVGFRMCWQGSVRLLGIDTPEPKGLTRDAGLAATAWVTEWMQQRNEATGWPWEVESTDYDNFGRCLGVITVTLTGEVLNEAVLEYMAGSGA